MNDSKTNKLSRTEGALLNPRKKVTEQTYSKKRTTRPSSLKLLKKSDLIVEELLTLHDKLVMKEEFKEPVPLFRGSDAPTMLRGPPLSWKPVATPVSSELLTTMRGLFGDRPYRVRLNTAFTMGSSGSGLVNSILYNSGLGSMSQFTALASVFDEFYVGRVDVRWCPASKYAAPIGFVNTTLTTASNVPLGVAKIQHSQASYSTLGAMTNNATFQYVNTGEEFSCSWLNADPITSTVVAMTGQSNPFQGWGPCANVAYVSGGIQFLSNTVPALPISAILGSFVTSYEVHFRLRL